MDEILMDKLNEVKEKLEDIQQINKQIHSALDVIEGNKTSPTADVEPEQQPNQESTLTPSTASLDPTAPSSYIPSSVQTGAVTSTTQDSRRNKNVNNQDIPYTQVDGFREKLDLKLNHVMYGSQLRRKQVEINQDNRICEHFKLDANKGCVYGSSRVLPNVDDAQGKARGSSRQQNQGFRQHRSSAKEREEKPARDDHRLRRQHSEQSSTSNASSKPRSVGHGKTQAQGQSLGEGQSQKRDRDHLKSHHARRKHEKREGLHTRDKTKAETRTQSHKAQQPVQTKPLQTKPVQTKPVQTKPEQRPERKATPAVEQPVAGAVAGAMMTFQDGQMRLMTPDEMKQFSELVKTEEFKQAVQEQVTPGALVDNTMQLWKQHGLNFGMDEATQRKTLQGFMGSMFDAGGQINFGNFFNENGKMDFAKMMELGMQFWKHAADSGLTATTSVNNSDGDQASGETKDQIENNGNSAAELQRTEEEKQFNDESPEEAMIVDPEEWIHYANEEVEKGKVCKDVREKGMDTIFCLDMSDSMKGAGWDQAVTFIKKFIEGIQNANVMDRVFEHVALVTFGSETRVQQHLTCDYFEITRKLDHLKPGGTSPMHAGIQMTYAAILGAGEMFRMHGYIFPARVYLITDGKATPAGLVSGRDKCTPTEFEEEQVAILNSVKQIHEKFDIAFNPVPVGSFDMSLLQLVADISEGKIISADDWRMQARSFKNYLKAAHGGGLMRTPELARLFVSLSIDSTPEDKMQMEEFLHRYKRAADSEDEEDEDLPPLGSRVQRRLQGATIIEQSRSALGTVTKHLADGNLGITWDVPDEDGEVRTKFHYDRNSGQVPVDLVESPRVLVDEMIAEGCRVKRGKDWHYEDQDGGDGSCGNVYKVCQNGMVKVRWDNGGKFSYRFGMDGKFELEILGQDVSSMVEDTSKETDERYLVISDSEAKRIEEMNKRNMTLVEDKHSSDQLSISNSGVGLAPSDTSGLSHGGACGVSPGGASRLSSRGANGESLDTFAKIRGSKNLKNAADKPQILNRMQTMERKHLELDGVEFNTRNAKNIPAKGDTQESIETHQGSRVINIGGAGHSSSYDDELAGAKPKTPLQTKSGIKGKEQAQWSWLSGETWQDYSTEENEKIENSFLRNPNGTTIIKLDDLQFRVVFQKMEQVNTLTKEKQCVKRRTM